MISPVKVSWTLSRERLTFSPSRMPSCQCQLRLPHANFDGTLSFRLTNGKTHDAIAIQKKFWLSLSLIVATEIWTLISDPELKIPPHFTTTQWRQKYNQ
jgi:hypothetical protein